MSNLFQISALAFALFLLAASGPAYAQLQSYPNSAVDIIGTTGAAAVSLGVPDYQFINDSGLGFGGTSADVFDVGESVELSFPVPLHNIAAEDDLIISAFVGGFGAVDNATVQVEASSDGINFVIVDTFDTQEARNPHDDQSPFSPEKDFEGVKHFRVDFGAEDLVTEIRLTNLAGDIKGLRLDAVEGLHPVVNDDYAFEVRFDRRRNDGNDNFFVRIKNIADVGGVPIREFVMVRSEAPGARLEDTQEGLYTMLSNQGVAPAGNSGESFICTQGCIGNPGPLISMSRHAWSLDGVVEAPPGIGLAAGQQVASQRSTPFDIDGTDYLTGMVFLVKFTDGLVHEFSYDTDVLQDAGSLYQKYLYFASSPSETGPRQTDYYQGLGASESPPVAVPSLSAPAYWILALAMALASGALILTRRDSGRIEAKSGSL